MRIRILTVNLPRLLGGVMGAIVAGDPALEMVGDTDVERALEATATQQPDVVVLGGTGAETERLLLECLRTLHPQLRIMTIDRDGQGATIYEPGGAVRSVAEMSPSTLVQMLRGPLQ